MEDKKIARQRVYKVIMLVVLTAVITFMTTTIFLYREYGDYIALGKSANGSSSTDKEAESTISATLKMFKNLIKSKYIYDVDNIKLVDGALKGYIDALGDPYTTYLTKEEMNILSNYKINYQNCSSVSELIYKIEDILENIESDELEFILDELSEYKYYNETNK